MGLMKGSITFEKFFVRGELPNDAHTRFLDRIRARGFKPLTPEDEDYAAVGWAPIERPLDDEISFRSEAVFFGSYMNIALRIDRWKFPATLVKAKMSAAEREYRQKTGKERISRAEKAELRDAVERKLRRDGAPVTLIADLSWDMSTGEARVFARSKVAIDHFYELFEKTFGMRVLPAGPYVTGVAVELPPFITKKLTTVEPVALRGGRI